MGDVVGLIQQEIDWHTLHHGESGCDEAWENGFIAGLTHTRNLIKRVETQPPSGVTHGFTWTCQWCGASLTDRDRHCPCGGVIEEAECLT